MFLLLGGFLSFIVGLVGVLNFFNAILTGITARRRELAVPPVHRHDGGRQLRTMLALEGLLYTLGAALLALALIVVTAPLRGPRPQRAVLVFHLPLHRLAHRRGAAPVRGAGHPHPGAELPRCPALFRGGAPAAGIKLHAPRLLPVFAVHPWRMKFAMQIQRQSRAGAPVISRGPVSSRFVKSEPL